MNKPTYKELEQRCRELDLLRQHHGIELASDPVALNETEACAAITDHWKAERCQSAYVVLRQFAATRRDANGEWALRMVTAANRKAEEYRQLYEDEKRRAIALRDMLEAPTN